MEWLQKIGESLVAAGGMLWSLLWALILGFAISGAILAFVPRKRMGNLLGKAGPREIALATFFGAASSSCSYAAASMMRSLFQKGAHIIPAMAFLLASTNLVLELSLMLWILLGWQFLAAELLGGVMLVIFMSVLMAGFGPLRAFEQKRQEMEKAGAGHGAGAEGDANPFTLEGWRAAARAFVGEAQMIWKDILIGIVLSGFLMVFVPDSFWRSLFLNPGPGQTGGFGKLLENVLVGPLVSAFSFICSVGNIPMAGVLYRGGIGFGGAVSFIFADLIILPLILVYRKYFGWKLALWITGLLYVSMALSGLAVDLLFTALGWIPDPARLPSMHSMQHGFQWNYTTWLNLFFLLVAAGLVGLARTGKAPQKEAHCCHG